LPLIDAPSANDAGIVNTLRQSRLIYLLGGFTGYLGQTLAGSTAWQAMLDVYAQGAVIAGSSAGAMVLCQYYYDPALKKVVTGLGLVPGACVLPHHNTFGKNWSAQLSAQLPQVTLLGIDERTGMIDDASTDQSTRWQVYGQGNVTLYQQGKPLVYRKGQPFSYSIP
jgi:cyanophycinase